MKRSASLIILVAGTLFASCSSLQTISFDQLQAADVSFPDAVRKVAVINNMPVLKTKDNHEILSSELEGDGKVASEALAENIANVNYFDQVIICDSVFRAQDKVPRVNVILTKEEVRKLSEDLGVDMILSFDRIHIQTKPGVLFYPDFPMPIDAVDGIISPIVRVYIPNRDKPLFVVAKQDTISWEIEPALSDRKIVKEASEYAASIPVEHLLPHWDEVARFYYDGGNIEMRDAGVYLRENNWDEAYSQWKIAYEKRKGQQKMKAAFNIALYYEIKDNVEQAKEWLGKAKKLVKSGSRDEQLEHFVVVLALVALVTCLLQLVLTPRGALDHALSCVQQHFALRFFFVARHDKHAYGHFAFLCIVECLRQRYAVVTVPHFGKFADFCLVAIAKIADKQHFVVGLHFHCGGKHFRRGRPDSILVGQVEVFERYTLDCVVCSN